jgi:hypothetical protein
VRSATSDLDSVQASKQSLGQTVDQAWEVRDQGQEWVLRVSLLVEGSRSSFCGVARLIINEYHNVISCGITRLGRLVSRPYPSASSRDSPFRRNSATSPPRSAPPDSLRTMTPPPRPRRNPKVTTISGRDPSQSRR